MTIENLGVKLYSGTKADRKSDSLGSAADGTNSGITLVSGIKNYAGFDGSNDYINLGGAVADWKFFHASGAKYSVSMWIKLDTVQYTQIFTTEDNSEANGVVMYINSSTQVGVQTWAGGSHTTVAVTTSEFEAGKWYHLVIARDGDDLLIYKDGTKTTGDYSGSVNSTNDASYVPRISGNHGQTAYRIDGAVQQTLVYTDALNQTEVNTLYNSGTPVTNPATSANGNSNKLKAWYKFQSNADDSHGSFDGTATGITWVSDAYKLGTGAYSFDGSNDYVKLGSASDWNYWGTSDWNISWWLRNDAGSSGTNRVFFATMDNSNAYGGMAIQIKNTNDISMWFYNSDGSSASVNDWSNAVNNTTSAWTHYSMNYDSTTYKAELFKDGISQGEKTYSSSVMNDTPNPYPFLLGARYNSSATTFTQYAEVSIDDLAYYKRKLTATEIADLVNAPNSWWIGGTSKNVTIDGNTVTTGSGSTWANWAQGKAVTAPTTLEFSVDDTNTNCIVGFGTGTGTDSPSAGSPMKHCAYLTSGGDIYWFDSTGEADTSSNRAAGDTYKLVWQSNGNLDLYLKPSGGSYGSSLKSWTSVTGTLYPMVQGYGGIVVTMLPTETADGALVSSLTNKSELKAYYSMDAVTTVNGSPIMNTLTYSGSMNFVHVGDSYKTRGEKINASDSALVGYKVSSVTVTIKDYDGNGLTGNLTCTILDSSGNAVSGDSFPPYNTAGLTSTESDVTFTNSNPTRVLQDDDSIALYYNGDSSNRVGFKRSDGGDAFDGTKTCRAYRTGTSGALGVETGEDHIMKIVPAVDGCVNDFSSTSALDGVTGIRTNSIFQQTDSTPSYWWYNGTSWVADGTTQPLDTDFSSSTGWTQSSGNFTIDTANSEMDFSVESGTNGAKAYYDLTSISDTKWVLRIEDLNFSTINTYGAMCIGVSSITAIERANASSSIASRIADYGDGADYIVVSSYNGDTTRVDGSVGRPTLSTGTNYSVELSRNGSTVTTKMFTGGFGGTLVGESTDTISGTTGQRYLFISQSYNTGAGNTNTNFVGTIQGMKFQNGVSEWLE